MDLCARGFLPCAPIYADGESARRAFAPEQHEAFEFGDLFYAQATERSADVFRLHGQPAPGEIRAFDREVKRM